MTGRFGRRVRRIEPNERAAFVTVTQLIKSGRFAIRYIAERTGHNESTILDWLNGSTQQAKMDTLLNVARLYGFKSMRTLCKMPPSQIAEAQRQKSQSNDFSTAIETAPDRAPCFASALHQAEAASL
jgi:hypothetical protein